MTIGDRIRTRREELGLTQKELAERLGYKTKSSITKIEAGDNNLPITKVAKIAKALEVTESYLMGWEDPTIVPTDGQSEPYYVDAETRQLAQELHDNPDLSVMLDAYKTLSPRDAKLVMDMVRRMQDEGAD